MSALILNAIITFLITALVVYFVFVAPMKKILDIASKKKQPIKADPTEVELLVQIRDLLQSGNVATVAQTAVITEKLDPPKCHLGC